MFEFNHRRSIFNDVHSSDFIIIINLIENVLNFAQ